MRQTILILLLLTASTLAAQGEKLWKVEAESEDARLDFRHDTVEIRTPAGLTLWWHQELKAPCVIEYEAMVVVRDSTDRLSDLNCFWMATDPDRYDRSVLAGMEKRGGVFKNAASMQLYYVGYGGNHNTTTRFRRYNGQPNPPLLREYTDPAHLLRPNHWYRIRIETQYQRTRFYIDDELLFDFTDPESLVRGWFGFRTTWSHCMIRRFRADCNPAD